MGKYLEEDASYNRLLEEYRKYGSLMVAVDFDDTVYDFHNKGYTYEKTIGLIRKLHAKNCCIIIWTGNSDYDFIQNYLSKHNIPYHHINEEPPFYKKILGDKKPRKLYANVYIDDRAGLQQVYNELTRLLDEI